MPSLEDVVRFIRERTTPAPVPYVPELVLFQATELTPLWQATANEFVPAAEGHFRAALLRRGLRAWDDSPYWAFPWAGGQALARHVLDRPDLVQGRRVLDFATGSGLVAIAAARAGAASVVAADVDPFCRGAVLLNAELNRVGIEFRAEDPSAGGAARADIVLAGDVFYERRLAEGALAWFRALAASGVRVLAGDAGRVYAPRSGFVLVGEHEVPTTVEIEDRPTRRARVIEILP
jgi:predicted nicotinamide N-methyase